MNDILLLRGRPDGGYWPGDHVFVQMKLANQQPYRAGINGQLSPSGGADRPAFTASASGRRSC